MSIFGSLGIVSAGFQTLVCCFSFRGIEGAKILGNMGFEQKGENLSLIMVEGGEEENKGHYIIENRLDALIEELDVDKNRIVGISSMSTDWNFKMMATTALLCALSITPYIYINLGANDLNLKKGIIWIFPILRSTGGFITAVLIQLLIQRRIITISREYLMIRGHLPVGNIDVEAAVRKKKYQTDARTWLLLCILLIGLLASVVGYVGCFSVVQNSALSLGPVSWLCLEGGLSVVRLALWAWNPVTDDAPPLVINLFLEKYVPLPTCNKDNEEILEHKVLPITRARDFWKVITSFAGLVKPFNYPDLSLYYTLTRKRPSKMSVLRGNGDDEPENAEKHELGERILYITVFDHKERTTRVYTRDDEIDTFYSTKLNEPLVDVGHHLFEVEIGTEIDCKGDTVCSDPYLLDSLRDHHHSILEHIRYRAETTRRYAIYTSWKMKVESIMDTYFTEWPRSRKEKERTEESMTSEYFMHSSIERERRLLDEKRVNWIARRMDMITKERLLGMGVEHRVNMLAVEKKPGTKTPEEVKRMLGWEQCYMELLLVCEVKGWEQLFWIKFKSFLVQISKYRVGEAERLTREWRANCWKRLNTQMHAAMKRMADVDDFEDKDSFLKSLGEEWTSCIRQFFEGVGNPHGITLPKLRRQIGDIDDIEIRLQIENEIEDIEFRLKRGSELGRFDLYCDDDALFDCRYSRSKWLYLNRISAPLEVYLHALKGNKNITHIIFGEMGSDFDFSRFLYDLPWVTSISPAPFATIPAVPRDRLFIKSSNNDLDTFAKEIKLYPPSTYIFSDVGLFDLISSKLGHNGKVLISFVAPTSDRKLILRVKHSGKEDAPLEVTLGSTIIQVNPSSKSSLTIDDITLHPIQVSGPESHQLRLSFVPKVRNDIFIRIIVPGEYSNHDHYLHDIELLDEAGLEYMPRFLSPNCLINIYGQLSISVLYMMLRPTYQIGYSQTCITLNKSTGIYFNWIFFQIYKDARTADISWRCEGLGRNMPVTCDN